MNDSIYGDASLLNHPALAEFTERREIIHCVREIKEFCQERIEQDHVINLDWVTAVQYLEKLEERMR